MRSRASALDVVHPGAGLLSLAARDVGDGGGAEGVAQRLDPLLPDPAGLFALLADDAVECLHHLEHVDLIGRARQRVTALGAAVADQDPGAPERREELLQELHGYVPPLRDL